MQTLNLSCYSQQAFQDTKISIMQQIGKKIDLTTLLNPLFSVVLLRFAIHLFFFSFFSKSE